MLTFYLSRVGPRLIQCNKPDAQIPQCTSLISHNAPFVTEMCICVYISDTKWCIVGYLSGRNWTQYYFFWLLSLRLSRFKDIPLCLSNRLGWHLGYMHKLTCVHQPGKRAVCQYSDRGTRTGPQVSYEVINVNQKIVIDISLPEWHSFPMVTSSNGNNFRATGLLCREFTGHRWIPLTKASEAALWCFLWPATEQMVE